MDYHFSKILHGDFDAAVAKVTVELLKEGFGVVSQIDIKDTFENKLGLDFKKYKILGACNPGYAFKAIRAENKIGTMLPCNIVVQEHSPDNIEVSAVNPIASMAAIKNNELSLIADEISQKLQRVINNL